MSLENANIAIPVNAAIAANVLGVIPDPLWNEMLEADPRIFLTAMLLVMVGLYFLHLKYTGQTYFCINCGAGDPNKHHKECQFRGKK